MTHLMPPLLMGNVEFQVPVPALDAQVLQISRSGLWRLFDWDMI